MRIPTCVISFVLLCTFLVDCKQKPRTKENLSKSYSNPTLYLDSISLEKFLSEHSFLTSQRDMLFDFYRRRGFAYAWMRGNGVDEQAGNFLNLLWNEKQITAADTFPAFSRLNALFNLASERKRKIDSKDSVTTELELLLSSAFFDYAKRNWSGVGDIYSKKVSWFIDRKQLNYSELLDSMLSGRMKEEPVYHQYHLLKQYLSEYDNLEKAGSRNDWTANVSKLQYGDTASVIPELRKQLLMLGDLTTNDSSDVFDSTLVDAVIQFQQRHGLREDGIIAANTLEQLSVSLHSRIEQILVNMERCRWVPQELTGDYVFVNIPAFTLYAYRNSKFQWSCSVVVGKDTTRTAIFNGKFQYVVFNPYWNIPRSILVNETLPAIKADNTYLKKHNMEVTDNNGTVIPTTNIEWEKYTANDFPYDIRQRPGDDNSLGRIKFLFPNSFGIYLHDTPAKSLFGETRRTFSHGCIRVEDAMSLAQFLLKNEKGWTAENIEELLATDKEKYIKLKNNIPVFIAYFTAWVDEEGRINFRDDVYGYDEKLRELLLQ